MGGTKNGLTWMMSSPGMRERHIHWVPHSSKLQEIGTLLVHHYRQQSVYFLLDKSSEKLPEQVAITASSQYGGTKTATLKATRATLNTTIHHLAARAAVRDLESQDVPDSLSSDIIRKNAEHLRQTYSISSKWASFVAVSHLQKEASTSEYVEVSLYKAPRAEIDLSETSYRGNQSQTFAHAPPWTKLA